MENETHHDQHLQHLADDLHDGLVQQLTAAKMMLEASLRHLPQQSLTEGVDRSEELASDLGRVLGLLDDSLGEARGLLDCLNVLPSLDRVTEGLDRFAGQLAPLVDVETDIDVEFDELTAEEKLLTLRAVQTLLGNVIRHSNASRAIVQGRMDAAQCQLSVVDNGRGWNEQSSAAGQGLNSIQRRLKQLGGTLLLDSTTEGRSQRIDWIDLPNSNSSKSSRHRETDQPLPSVPLPSDWKSGLAVTLIWDRQLPTR